MISVDAIANAWRLLLSWALAEQTRVLPAEMGRTYVSNLKRNALDTSIPAKEEPPGFEKPKAF
ncbi:hypothetical protein ACPOL_1856 [Acidisarcina polymorpha]|uniref:Uncharacterized protein n=1 Tax=Acidisarcina polymorpha TaxID=2211140 RepID=A0A2Z5FXU8_9BACT|nr:hypothetical protein ACPOL_1856 [Acidisarcina polymorpha]